MSAGGVLGARAGLLAQPAQAVVCSGGVGRIRCATAQGLPPGGQAEFTFRLQAALNAVGGEVTGTISGGAMDVQLAAVQVVVRPLPDAIDLRASVTFDSPKLARLVIEVVDTGRSSGPVTTTVALPDGVHAVQLAPGCTGVIGTITCRTSLSPGQLAKWQLLLGANHQVSSGATITAQLGTARQSQTVQLRLGAPCFWPPGQPPPPHCPPGHVPNCPPWLLGLDLCIILGLPALGR